MTTTAGPLAPPATLRTGWVRLVAVTVALVAVIMAGSMGAVALVGADPSEPRSYVAAKLTGSAVAELVVLGVVVLLLRRRGASLRDIGWGRRTTTHAVLLGAGVGVAYAGLTALALPEVLDHALRPTLLNALALATSVAVAGVVEEVVFRGWVMTSVQHSGHGRVAQVVASAVLFGLAHPSNPVALVMTMLLGAGLAWAFLAGGRSLTPAIVGHALVNVVIEPGLFLEMAALAA